jgi:Rieske Fe-S protein
MDHPASESTTPLPARRNFLQWLTYSLGAIATVIVGVPLVGYLLGARKRSDEWVSVGTVKEFMPENAGEPGGQTRLVALPKNPNSQAWDGITAQTGVFVRYEGQDPNEKDEEKRYQFKVFAVNCAHLGCPVSWFPQSGLFMCPCHGGVYYANGDRASGPPPRGLFRYATRVEAGKLLIRAPHYPTLQDTLGGDA